MPPLVRLRAFYRRHERVRHRRLLLAGGGGLRRREPVEGHADGELQGAELEARGVCGGESGGAGAGAGAGARAAARVAQGGGGESQERGDGVERRRLSVAASARDGDCVVECTRGLVG